MKKTIIALVLLSVFLIVNFVDIVISQEIEDSIKQQLISKYSQYSDIQFSEDRTPREVLRQLIAQDPEIRNKITKVMAIFIGLVTLLIIELFLKGFAMWKASKKNSKAWFWLILFTNTFGILPLLYLIFSKRPEKRKK